MNPTLPAPAVEFGLAAQKAFLALGALDAARRAELEPGSRSDAAAALDALGVAEMDPRSDLETAAAAAELCRAAGRVALPYPVVPVLLAERSAGAVPLGLVADRAGNTPGGGPKVDHGDLFPEWELTTMSGPLGRAGPAGPRLATRLGPFVTPMAAPTAPSGNSSGTSAGTSAGFSGTGAARLHLTLTAWQVLGCVERALELAVEHVTGRVQFGQPLASFQAVQFQLADATVGVDGLRELCGFTLWRLFTDARASLPDALALRLHALDVGRTVLRTCQQLHGAAGLCDEYDISVLCRHVQPALRLPFGVEETVDALARAVSADGFEGLFPHGGAPGTAGGVGGVATSAAAPG